MPPFDKFTSFYNKRETTAKISRHDKSLHIIDPVLLNIYRKLAKIVIDKTYTYTYNNILKW